ncbi:thiosulfate sulfurtransferase/rhodanese-like domain-containing protein 3 isoform X2 [Colossoma macropomum]|uniref:thiosulfate sulfurtransferase/rhodanese-like domain-containing protein 3 isoform X2 n=1 Tax=Colossoma macropomum TaxID=42526 RepID=UPI0018640943|nr:thiosulfate sulfurtransferase/rhodanese-like domain-containing protein 3 isoform X2 [Colossoma macropomum]
MALKICCRLARRLARAVGRRDGFAAGPPARRSAAGLQYQYAVAKQRPSCSWRSLCSASQSSPVVTYEELKKLLVAKSGVVVDVREPWELREYGNIPGSINVPLGQVNGALQLKPEEFKEKYGGSMPSTTENVVFTCLAGARSIKALEAAVSLGYSNAQHYPGGWQDWAKHEILQTKD